MPNFYTDVIKKSPVFGSTSRIRSLDLLEPAFRRKVIAILNDAQGHHRPMVVFETYRSQARQQQLFDEGATKLQHVGVHHYGLACDLVFLVRGEPSWNVDYELLGHLAHAHGLVWGGEWQHFPDLDHVQGVTLPQQPGLFEGSWYPDPDRT